MVKFSFKNLIRAYSLLVLTFLSFSCNFKLNDLLEDEGAVHLAGSISASENGTLVGKGTVTFSFVLPEDPAPSYNGKKGYKLNLKTNNLSSFFKYKLSSSQDYSTSSNWNNEFLYPGTYSVIFTNSSEADSSYSVQFSINTDMAYMTAGGAVFSSLNLTKEDEDSSNLELITIPVGLAYTNSLKDFNCYALSSATKKLYEFEVPAGQMLNIMYKDARGEINEGITETTLGSANLEIWKSDGTLIYNEDNNANAGFGIGKNNIIRFEGDAQGSYKVKFKNVKDGNVYLWIWGVKTLDTLSSGSNSGTLEECDSKYDSTGTNEGKAIFSSDETDEAHLQTYSYNSIGDSPSYYLLSVKEGKKYNFHWLDSQTIKTTTVSSYLNYGYTDGVFCVYDKDNNIVLLNDDSEYTSFTANYTGNYILSLQRANSTLENGYTAIRVYKAPVISEIDFTYSLYGISFPTDCNYVKLAGAYDESKFELLLTKLASIKNQFTLDMSNLSGLTTIEGTNITTGSKFKSLTNMVKIILPNSLESIGKYAFDGCSNLQSVVISQNVTKIDNYAFYYCTSITKIVIPDSVTSIGENSFNGCTKLSTVNFPNGLTSIGLNAFKSCTSLTQIVLPDTLTYLGTGAFNSCSKLTNVTLSENLTEIRSQTFEYCSYLGNITIPRNVVHIGKNVFNGCSRVSIYFTVTTGWHYTDSALYKDGTAITLNNNAYYTSMTNKTYFTSTYKDYYWYRE